MADIFLVRHGEADAYRDVIYGRRPGLHLTEKGRGQAASAADALKTAGFDIILSSPMERTSETAAVIAAASGLDVATAPEFIEVEVGEWTGRTFQELGDDPLWRRFNTFRSDTRAPGGESILDVQCRMVAGVQKYRSMLPDGRICIVSHADPIKTVLVHYLGIPLDMMSRLEIDTGSITLLSLGDSTAVLRFLNLTGDAIVRR